MRSQEAPQRYAKALYRLATENKHVEAVLNQVRELGNGMQKDPDVKAFFLGRAGRAENQRKALEEIFNKKKFAEEVYGLVMLLVDKRRLSLLPEIVEAFEAVVDASRGVARGEVQSAATLFPEERQQLEAIISRYTGKKVVLEYKENKGLLGGLVAQVGSFTFDDSLETQLRLMKDALKYRRAN